MKRTACHSPAFDCDADEYERSSICRFGHGVLFGKENATEIMNTTVFVQCVEGEKTVMNQLQHSTKKNVRKLRPSDDVITINIFL